MENFLYLICKGMQHVFFDNRKKYFQDLRIEIGKYHKLKFSVFDSVDNKEAILLLSQIAYDSECREIFDREMTNYLKEENKN